MNPRFTLYLLVFQLEQLVLMKYCGMLWKACQYFYFYKAKRLLVV